MSAVSLQFSIKCTAPHILPWPLSFIFYAFSFDIRKVQRNVIITSRIYQCTATPFSQVLSYQEGLQVPPNVHGLYPIGGLSIVDTAFRKAVNTSHHTTGPCSPHRHRSLSGVQPSMLVPCLSRHGAGLSPLCVTHRLDGGSGELQMAHSKMRSWGV